jgi:hypothetical protein
MRCTPTNPIEQELRLNGNQPRKRGLSRRLVREAQAQEHPQAPIWLHIPTSDQLKPNQNTPGGIPNHSQSPSDSYPAALIPYTSLSHRLWYAQKHDVPVRGDAQ